MTKETDLTEIYMDLSSKLSSNSLPLPIDLDDDNFVLGITTILHDWLFRYNDELQPIFNKVKWKLGVNPLDNVIQPLIDGIIQTINQSFAGNILEATQTFNNTLSDIGYTNARTLITVEPQTTFYRSRLTSGHQFSREDMFHIPFEQRRWVSTNRYSIPGLPALYLADSTYVCWEEFDRPRFREMYFSRFQNTHQLKVVRLQRFEDLLIELKSYSIHESIRLIARYCALYPLTLACCVRVKDRLAPFKPEYIIPQLLTQFVASDPGLDGIQFPSSKVDYRKLRNMHAYNYVFPVKKIKAIGHCQKLTKSFQLTAPTSLELEEVIDSPRIHGGGARIVTSPVREIELIDGLVNLYQDSSFGHLEYVLGSRPIVILNSL